MIKFGTVCPVARCIGIIVNKTFGYCLAHCIEFGMICANCTVEDITRHKCNRCTKITCVAVSYGQKRCDETRADNSKFCKIHAEMAREICSCHGTRMINGECVYKLKKEGIICATDDCMTYAFAGTPLCFLCSKQKRHICAADRCCRSTTNSLSYCNKHFEYNRAEGLVCVLMDCRTVRFHEEPYCELHCRREEILCAENLCENKPHEDRKYCINHAKKYGLMCVMDDCFTANPAIGGEDITSLGAEVRELPRTICDMHSCFACGEKAISPMNVCMKHKCRIKGCDKSVIDGVNYCKTHKCAAKECDDKICGRLPDVVSRFCLKHTCSMDICVSIAKFPNGYCAKHGCRIEGCKGSNKCVVHKCRHEKCKQRIKAIGHEACLEHTCTISACKNKMVERAGDLMLICSDHAGCTTCLRATRRSMIARKLPNDCIASLPIHYLTVCDRHSCCPECLKDANKTRSYGLFCKAACHDKSYQFQRKFLRSRSDPPFTPMPFHVICSDHLRPRFYAYIMLIRRFHILIPKEICRIIWDAITMPATEIIS